MGCVSSKYSSALDTKLKGTVLVAFCYKEGIIVGVESRGSSEDKPNYALASKLQFDLPSFLSFFFFLLISMSIIFSVRDNINKMVSVSSKIIYVIQGVHADCMEMNEHIIKKFPVMVRASIAMLQVLLEFGKRNGLTTLFDRMTTMHLKFQV